MRGRAAKLRLRPGRWRPCLLRHPSPSSPPASSSGHPQDRQGRPRAPVAPEDNGSGHEESRSNVRRCLRSLGPCASRRRAPQHDPDPVERAAARRRRRPEAQGDRSRHRGDRDHRRRGAATAGSTTVPAHVIYDIVRKLPDGAQVSLETTGDTGQMQIRSGRSRFQLQALPESDFPDIAAGELPHRFALAGRRPQAPDRQDAVRDLDRGDALLSQRHLSAHHRRRGPAVLRAVATDGHRLARVEIAGAGGRRGHARRDRAAQGRRRDPEARSRTASESVTIELSAGQDPRSPSAGTSVADLEADRRHLPRLSARHPAAATTSS